MCASKSSLSGLAVAVVNILFGVGIIYLFVIYAQLASWWFSLKRTMQSSSSEGVSSFLASADQIHISTILLAVLNLISAVVLWRGKTAPSAFALVVVFTASAALLLYIVLSI